MPYCCQKKISQGDPTTSRLQAPGSAEKKDEKTLGRLNRGKITKGITGGETCQLGKGNGARGRTVEVSFLQPKGCVVGDGHDTLKSGRLVRPAGPQYAENSFICRTYQ